MEQLSSFMRCSVQNLMHFCSVQTYLTDAATLISDKAITNGAGEAPGQPGQARWCNWFIPPVAIDVVFRLQRQSVCVIDDCDPAFSVSYLFLCIQNAGL